MVVMEIMVTRKVSGYSVNYEPNVLREVTCLYRTLADVLIGNVEYK